MTIWDDIYKNYQKGGDAWATLKDGLLPRFIAFVQNNDFDKKSALDIGCGDGKYLVYLKRLGFEVHGIDSSETAVEMTRKVLSDDSNILCVNMYEYEIPENKYDFIFSISTIHHGLKKEVVGLIDQIYNKILHGGKIFITLPDTKSNKNWNTFKDDQELAPGTYAPQSGPEKGLSHSFFSETEIKQIFSKFREVNLEMDKIGRWCVTGVK